ncbi:MAG: hypothetical protein JJV98_22240, partial [Desulfosarcina sp.]|nr:hypothetical protein [Desulfobacterales bacterium]
MKRWKIIISLTLVFILGVMAGVVGTGLAVKHPLPYGNRGPEGRKAFFIKRLERKLDLAADQKVRV